jgi:deoxycytidylate deaminase
MISSAFNRSKYPHFHEETRRGQFGLHAEQMALNRVGRNQIDTLLVIRLNSQDGLAMSFPCKRCYKQIKRAGVRTILFSDFDGTIQRLQIK